MVGVKRRARNQLRYDAHMPAPPAGGTICGNQHFHVEPASPAFEFFLIHDVVGRTRAVEQNDAPIVAAICQHAIQQGAQWREANAAGYHNDILAIRLVHRPSAAIGTAHVHDLTRVQARHGLRYRAHGACGMDQSLPHCRIAAD